MKLLRALLSRLLTRFPLLQKLFGVGWKVILTEALIEIPFLILESSVLMRLLFGFTLGLTLWQYMGLATALYLLIEGGRWALGRFTGRADSYRFFKHERELLQILLNWLTRLRRKPEV